MKFLVKPNLSTTSILLLSLFYELLMLTCLTNYLMAIPTTLSNNKCDYTNHQFGCDIKNGYICQNEIKLCIKLKCFSSSECSSQGLKCICSNGFKYNCDNNECERVNNNNIFVNFKTERPDHIHKSKSKGFSPHTVRIFLLIILGIIVILSVFAIAYILKRKKTAKSLLDNQRIRNAIARRISRNLNNRQNCNTFIENIRQTDSNANHSNVTNNSNNEQIISCDFNLRITSNQNIQQTNDSISSFPPPSYNEVMQSSGQYQKPLYI